MSESGDKSSRIRVVLDFLRRLLRKKPPQLPGDPFAYRMAPIRRGPKGRGAAAVAEIEDDTFRDFPPRTF